MLAEVGKGSAGGWQVGTILGVAGRALGSPAVDQPLEAILGALSDDLGVHPLEGPWGEEVVS